MFPWLLTVNTECMVRQVTWAWKYIHLHAYSVGNGLCMCVHIRSRIFVLPGVRPEQGKHVGSPQSDTVQLSDHRILNLNFHHCCI